MRFGSLFAGIGGLDLGLERAGMECAWQVEQDDYCQRVLTEHWPDVPKYGDIRELDVDSLERVDLVAGGFPCQPVSYAGKRKAQTDDRWLWPEFRGVLRKLRPRYALLENVPGLLTAGFDIVLGDLAALGYDASWDCIPAAAVGAPHRRDRIFVVAYSDLSGLEGQHPWDRLAEARDKVPPTRDRWWSVEPPMDRVAYGVSGRVDRLRALGNAVVPQVAEHVGRLIMEHACLAK